MNHLSLFNGIGGFQLAAEYCGWVNVAHVEEDEFCNEVAAYRYPDSTCYLDIKEFDGSQYHGRIDVVSGGFPCQPYSISGKRLGNDDDRALWPEMLRVVREVAPAFVVGENVVGAADMELHNWTADLESVGYEVTSFDIPASACGLPTMERHLWIVASTDGVRRQRDGSQQAPTRSAPGELPGDDSGVGGRRDIRESRFRRVGERVSSRLDKTGRQRLRAIGNAIPPYVAYRIFSAIQEASCKASPVRVFPCNK